MLVVKQILRQGHENMDPNVLDYMKSMADRHGFTVLDGGPLDHSRPARIEINYPLLKERIFMAILEER
jgi:hypothetical protein